MSTGRASLDLWPPIRASRRSGNAWRRERTRRRCSTPASVRFLGAPARFAHGLAKPSGQGGVCRTRSFGWPVPEIYCPLDASYSDASWPQTAASSTAAGTCAAGFITGAPLRTCQIDGTWSLTVVNPCQRALPVATVRCSHLHDGMIVDNTVHGRCFPRGCAHPAITCPAYTDSNGNVFPATDAGSIGNGTCVPGFEEDVSAPSQGCDITGNWLGTISTPCIRTVLATPPRLLGSACDLMPTLRCHITVAGALPSLTDLPH